MGDIFVHGNANLAADEWLNEAAVSDVPDKLRKALKLDPFYERYIDAMGIPVVASGDVSDAALIEAAYLARSMLAKAPDIAERIAARKGRIAVMAYRQRTRDIPEHAGLDPAAYDQCRGVGGTLSIPVSSCGEEDLLEFPGEPYWAENVFIHEFAHTIHLVGMDERFDKRLQEVYDNAMKQQRWQNAVKDGAAMPAYAAQNHHEYWAEGVQSYFGCNCDHADPSHNGINGREQLQAYDPELFDLVEEVFGQHTWCYVSPKERTTQPHLAQLDRANLPHYG